MDDFTFKLITQYVSEGNSIVASCNMLRIPVKQFYYEKYKRKQAKKLDNLTLNK